MGEWLLGLKTILLSCTDTQCTLQAVKTLMLDDGYQHWLLMSGWLQIPCFSLWDSFLAPPTNLLQHFCYSQPVLPLPVLVLAHRAYNPI